MNQDSQYHLDLFLLGTPLPIRSDRTPKMPPPHDGIRDVPAGAGGPSYRKAPGISCPPSARIIDRRTPIIIDPQGGQSRIIESDDPFLGLLASLAPAGTVANLQHHRLPAPRLAGGNRPLTAARKASHTRSSADVGATATVAAANRGKD